MSKRSQEVFEVLLEDPDSDPRAVIESKVNEEETVTCPDCDTDFPKDTGYCPSCEEKKDISEAVQGVGELKEYKVKDFRDRLENELDRYTGWVEYANFELFGVSQRRINDRPSVLFEIRTSAQPQSEDDGEPASEMYYVILGYNREPNTITTTIRRGDPQSGQTVNDQTTFYTEGAFDFNEQYMRSLIDRIIDDINVDFYENVK